MRPGSVAAAGAASGRPSHHHAAATAAMTRMNEATSFGIEDSVLRRAASSPGRSNPWERGRPARTREDARGTPALPAALRRTHSIEGPRRNLPRPRFSRDRARRLNAARPRCRSKHFDCCTTRHDWTKSVTSAIDERQIWKAKFAAVIRHTEPRAPVHNPPSSRRSIVRPMFRVAWRFLAIVVSATTFAAIPLFAQNGEQKPAEAGKGEAAKEAAGRMDEIA